MFRDARHCLTEARDAYHAAIERRNALTPHAREYPDAVLETALRLAQVRYWERRLIEERLHRAPEPVALAG